MKMKNMRFFLFGIIKQVPPPSPWANADNLSPKLSNYPQNLLSLHFWIRMIMASFIKLNILGNITSCCNLRYDIIAMYLI